MRGAPRPWTVTAPPRSSGCQCRPAVRAAEGLASFFAEDQGQIWNKWAGFLNGHLDTGVRFISSSLA